MGLEKHVDNVLKDEGCSADYRWEHGLKVENAQDADEIMECLEASFEFGPTRFNAKTFKVEFGVHRNHMRSLTDDQYTEYVRRFQNFEIDG